MKKTADGTTKRRSCKGMGSVELAITAIVGVLFACLAVDIGLMMLGNQILDRATRDAARAAAGQSDADNAKLAAIAALNNHKSDGFYVSNPTLVPSEFEYVDYGGTPEGQTIPPGSPGAGSVAGASYVAVVATTDVSLPANLSMFGSALSMKQGPLVTGKMTFRRRYWFPLIRQSLNNAFQ